MNPYTKQQDQLQRTVELDMRQAMQAHIQQEARHVYIESAYAWSRTISDRYSMAVYSFVTARYEDVIKDVLRNRLTLSDVKTILDKLVELKAINEACANVWFLRMPKVDDVRWEGDTFERISSKSA